MTDRTRIGISAWTPTSIKEGWVLHQGHGAPFSLRRRELTRSSMKSDLHALLRVLGEAAGDEEGPHYACLAYWRRNDPLGYREAIADVLKLLPPTNSSPSESQHSDMAMVLTHLLDGDFAKGIAYIEGVLGTSEYTVVLAFGDDEKPTMVMEHVLAINPKSAVRKSRTRSSHRGIPSDVIVIVGSMVDVVSAKGSAEDRL